MGIEAEPIGPPPADTPAQIEEKLNAALDDKEQIARAAEIARHIEETRPPAVERVEQPLAPVTPIGPPPESVPMTAADFPPAAEVTVPFAPTQESVAAEEQRKADIEAKKDEIAVGAEHLNDEAVRLGIITPEQHAHPLDARVQQIADGSEQKIA